MTLSANDNGSIKFSHISLNNGLSQSTVFSISLTATEKDIETAKEFLNANFDSIADKIYPMAMKVKEYGYSTPIQSAKSILYIIDTFNLWDIEIFNFGDEKIKTHKACLKFMEEN